MDNLPVTQEVLESVTLDQLPQAAKAAISFAGKERIWLFDGNMGAGKTLGESAGSGIGDAGHGNACFLFEECPRLSGNR